MSLMLVNPSPRRKHRSAAQRAATRRLVAHNKSRRSNPVRRKRLASTKRRVVRHHNPIFAGAVKRHKRHARRRNPISLRGGNLGGMLMQGLKGAGGAVVVNAAVSFLPATFNTGMIGYVARTGVALAMGSFGGRLGREMAEGSLAVTFHDAFNNFFTTLPGAGLHGYLSGGGMSPAISGEQLSGYLSGDSGARGQVMDSELATLAYR